MKNYNFVKFPEKYVEPYKEDGRLLGAKAIADYIGDIYYLDLGILLKVLNAPKEMNRMKVPTFCITTEQADKLKNMIMEMRSTFK